ncbi:NAD(P)-binding protein [Suhomyces tanzawaensis NRRL Y-17324]|uniref:NAD(P)-binding protein n=1 Tax=Suhomyces tanzawaensis NRRL Y-17324 TaxID=984487 RepID=A0A1E4SEP3_9ASCO|nr:NAD(P)-binding protein [Suhomyces tanzawaensis NRRL Y-17324]ODV77953.1 NAD(P)-binding protein [Suhomyces tanzawaensis NRRL Y-17324]
MSLPTTLNYIKLKTAPSHESELKDGDVFVKHLYFSNDPTQRVYIQKDSVPSRCYMDPVLEGEPMRAFGISEIILSKSDKYAPGDLVYGTFSWSDYQVINEAFVWMKIDDKTFDIPTQLSNLGHTGLTAYFGLTHVLKMKEGQTIVISAAAGATGSVAVQIAKHMLKSAKVIGLAGTEDKCRWVESLGADICINYHDADYKEQLDKAIGPDYIDLYFDNVGGEMLSHMFTRVKKFGRIAACGSIIGYNDDDKNKLTNWTNLIFNYLTVEGFIVTNYAEHFPEAFGFLIEGLSTGKIKNEGSYYPLTKVPEILDLIFGSKKPNGKLLTRIA